MSVKKNISFEDLIYYFQVKNIVENTNVLCSRAFSDRWVFIMENNVFMYELLNDKNNYTSAICALLYNHLNNENMSFALLPNEDQSQIINTFQKQYNKNKSKLFHESLSNFDINIFILDWYELQIYHNSFVEERDNILLFKKENVYYPIFYDDHQSIFPFQSKQIQNLFENKKIKFIKIDEMNSNIQDDRDEQMQIPTTHEISKQKIAKWKLDELQTVAIHNRIDIFKKTNKNKLINKTKQELYDNICTIAEKQINQ